MPSYLTLGKYTKQGIDNIGDIGDRLAAVKEAASEAGGRLIFFYLTFGQYDFAAVVELPDDETAAKLVIQQNQVGNIQTETVRAFTEEEAIAIATG